MFQKAVRAGSKLKVAMTGVSGSGKTYSALTLATGMRSSEDSKIAVLDTENLSSNLYADSFVFDVWPMKAPYSVDKYISVIAAATSSGYETLIIDSLSHCWAGTGGILDQKAAMDAKGGNSYTNWARFTPLQEKLIEHIKTAEINIIATMRSKHSYVIQPDEKGRQVPKKVGLEPIQREGVEYEFSIVFDLDTDHNFSISKDRTGLFAGKRGRISKEIGKQVSGWIQGGRPNV